MALTTSEKNKMEKIEQAIATKKKEREALIEKLADQFSKCAMKYNLWKLDKKVVDSELKSLAEKHKTI